MEKRQLKLSSVSDQLPKKGWQMAALWIPNKNSQQSWAIWLPSLRWRFVICTKTWEWNWDSICAINTIIAWEQPSLWFWRAYITRGHFRCYTLLHHHPKTKQNPRTGGCFKTSMRLDQATRAEQLQSCSGQRCKEQVWDPAGTWTPKVCAMLELFQWRTAEQEVEEGRKERKGRWPIQAHPSNTGVQDVPIPGPGLFLRKIPCLDRTGSQFEQWVNSLASSLHLPFLRLKQSAFWNTRHSAQLLLANGRAISSNNSNHYFIKKRGGIKQTKNKEWFYYNDPSFIQFTCPDSPRRWWRSREPNNPPGHWGAIMPFAVVVFTPSSAWWTPRSSLERVPLLRSWRLRTTRRRFSLWRRWWPLLERRVRLPCL